MDNRIMVIACDERLWKERPSVSRRKIWSMIEKISETMKMNIDRQQWGQTILQAENDE
jgi:hypothetical protein